MQARVTPCQATLLLLFDLEALSVHIFTSLSNRFLEPHQIYILAKNQAFLKVLFFSGDRAADLALVKTQEILRFPDTQVFSLITFGRRSCAKVMRIFSPLKKLTIK